MTVYLGIILVNNQLDAQLLLYIFIVILYITDHLVHVSSKLVLIIRRVNCINTTSSFCH